MTNWQTMAGGAGAAAALLLWFAGLQARDTEAFVLGVFVAGAAAVVVRARRRWLANLGRVVLALFFVDIAAWMVPAVVSNSVAGEGVGDLALPLALSATAIVGVLALGAAIVGLAGGRRGGVALVATVVVLTAIASVVASAGREERSVVRPGDIEVGARNVQFSTDRVSASGPRVAVVVSNDDLFWHTFTIAELDVNVRVPTGGARRVEFTAEPGSYEFVCAIPGHELRMRGRLTVR